MREADRNTGTHFNPNMVVQGCNLATMEDETGGLPAQGLPGLE